MKMFATLDSHVQLDSYEIHTPYFAGVFSGFLSTCTSRYIAEFVCVRHQEVVESHGLNTPPSVSRHLNGTR